MSKGFVCVLIAMTLVTACAAAAWYQAEPHAPFPALPPPDVLKVVPLQVAAPPK